MDRDRRNKLTQAIASSVTLSMLLAGVMQTASAELREIDDTELSDVVGQSMFAFDVTETAGVKQTKFTAGLDVETQINFDQVTLGEYQNANATQAADLDITQMSLGHIENGNIVPFEAKNPYFEIVQDNGELTGFRVGFEDSRGSVSGDINSFSGNLGLQVVDENGTVQNTFLLDDQNNQTNNRATQIGLIIVPPPAPEPEPLPEQPPGPEVTNDPAFPNDPQMPADLEPKPVADAPPELRTSALSKFKTHTIGGQDSNGNAQFAKDFFFSFQTKDMQWQGAGGTQIQAGPGVHFNLPSTTQIDLQQFDAGIPRARTEYVDRGLGLF